MAMKAVCDDCKEVVASMQCTDANCQMYLCGYCGHLNHYCVKKQVDIFLEKSYKKIV